jgi:hypothetical protein
MKNTYKSLYQLAEEIQKELKPLNSDGKSTSAKPTGLMDRNTRGNNNG